MDSWPHGPYHSRLNSGTLMLTSGVYLKRRLFNTKQKLDFLQDQLIQLSSEFAIDLHAWALFENHYHVVLHLPEEDDRLKKFIRRLHGATSAFVNKLDQTPGRQVWHQYWDTDLTYETSYLARLKYVHYNPVKHGLVRNPRDYDWSSARWFEDTAPRSFVETVASFAIDRVNVYDPF